MLPCLLQITYKSKKEGRNKNLNDTYTNNNDDNNTAGNNSNGNDQFKYIKNNKFIEGIRLGDN